jgi:hypothetical protein
MRPVHTLHLHQPNDRIATVVTSGSSHRLCGARHIRGIAWLLSYAKKSVASPATVACHTSRQTPLSRSAADCWQPAIPVGATRGTRVAMRPVRTQHLYQPNDRFATVVTSGSSHRLCAWRCSPAVRCLCGSNSRHEGRDEAGAYTASLSARRPLRQGRNLRQSTTD